MISTDITGSVGGDASQVFNLLSVVANPEVYGEKLRLKAFAVVAIGWERVVWEVVD